MAKRAALTGRDPSETVVLPSPHASGVPAKMLRGRSDMFPEQALCQHRTLLFNINLLMLLRLRHSCETPKLSGSCALFATAGGARARDSGVDRTRSTWVAGTAPRA